jgi:predicted Rossmann fold flavoprotein
VSAVIRNTDRFEICTDGGTVSAKSLVIATGGLSIPKMGASDFGYRVARQFGMRIVEARPGLVPLVFQSDVWEPFVDLAGLSLEADVRCEGMGGRINFREDLLFTHRGLSGPGILQISSYWKPGESICIDLAPEFDWEAAVRAKGGRRAGVATMLGGVLPRRLSELLVQMSLTVSERGRLVADIPDKSLRQLAIRVSDWRVVPNGTEGFKKAEVTVGGVDTRDLSSQTMEARAVPGLHFIGEVVDVTGWLGGYNFQWAWASAVACARGLP